jgi:hypothetical protein
LLAGKAFVLMIALGALLGTGCNKTLPNDGENAKTVTLSGLNRVRYIEIFVIGGDPLKGQLRGNVYNTTAIPGWDLKTNKDAAPDAYVQGIDKEAIKKEFNAYAVAINGPKLWMLDDIDIPLGTNREFNGKQIPWCAELHLTPEALLTMGKEGYKPTTSERKSKFEYKKGTQVFLIDDADGTTWIMKGMQIGILAQYTYDQYVANQATMYKKLPAGWKVRTRVLDQDLILIPAAGVATIMPDEFFNVYDKTGPGYSSYKP